MNKVKCIDIGTKSCPCILAMNNECIQCNMLNSNNKCNCIYVFF